MRFPLNWQIGWSRPRWTKSLLHWLGSWLCPQRQPCHFRCSRRTRSNKYLHSKIDTYDDVDVFCGGEDIFRDGEGVSLGEVDTCRTKAKFNVIWVDMRELCPFKQIIWSEIPILSLCLEDYPRKHQHKSFGVFEHLNIMPYLRLGFKFSQSFQCSLSFDFHPLLHPKATLNHNASKEWS